MHYFFLSVGKGKPDCCFAVRYADVSLNIYWCLATWQLQMEEDMENMQNEDIKKGIRGTATYSEGECNLPFYGILV